jgi:NAD+ kinase
MDFILFILGNASLLFHNRLACRLERASKNNEESKVVTDSNNNKSDWVGLNEIVVDRGLNPYLFNIDLYLNDYLITTVQGGLIISSPTGSTAYSMAAGASMCHPSVPAVVICPICPYSLSFRPIVVPIGVELKIVISKDAINSAVCSVDGHRIAELKAGDR